MKPFVITLETVGEVVALWECLQGRRYDHMDFVKELTTNLAIKIEHESRKDEQ